MPSHPLTLVVALGIAAGAFASAPPPGGAAGELTAEERARHVLGRLAFGARPGEVQRVVAMGVDRWIALQLAPDRIDDPATDHLLAAFPTLRMGAARLFEAYPPPGAALVARRMRGDSSSFTRDDSLAVRRTAASGRVVVRELMSARVARAVASERQLEEVMTDFWLNHFSVFAGKGQLRYHLADFEHAAIRPHALGRFRDLLGAVAASPAMLLYLDNASSGADSTRATLGRRPRGATRQGARPRGLNENYARELLELHTLGVDGGYTQDDVVAVARALTGWTVRPRRLGTPEFLFAPGAHDAEEKRVLGHRLPAGRGLADGESVLDILARHPSTARHVARKLATRLVSDTPPGALVTRAAETFRRTDGDLREVVRTIVTSPEFFSRAALRAKVKSPFEVVVSAARALGIPPDTTARSAAAVARLGQPIYGHQAPNGWPETGAPWMNTGAILARINFGLAVAGSREVEERLHTHPDLAPLRGADHAEQVDGVIDALLGGDVSPETRRILSTGEHPLLPPDGGQEPERRRRLPRGLAQVVGLALGAPEFQRR